MYVVAGCNGSGKSTFMRSVTTFQAAQVIDPDALFAELGSWKAVVSCVDRTLAMRADLVLETTLAGRTILQKMHAAKANGYAIVLIFIGTATPVLNIGRIQTRTRLGGHVISAQDVQRRWHTSLDHLRPAARIADRILLLDNSSTRERFALVASIDHGAITRGQRTPRWAKAALSQIEGTNRWQ